MALFRPTYIDKKTGERKTSKIWWYEFVFNGERCRGSTKTANERGARQIEAAERLRLAKGEAGIRDRPTAPTLAEFRERFENEISTVCAEKPKTIGFYQEKLRRLLEDSILAQSRLDAIDEASVDAYKHRRSRQASRFGRPVSPASINRELATLRRMLRLAHAWQIVDRLPRIRLLRGEKHRDLVLSQEQEQAYLDACPRPLGDIAVLLLDTGLRLGEALSLAWPQVRLQPAHGAKFAFVTVLSGKSKNHKSRNVPLSDRAVAVLREIGAGKTGLVFHRDGGSPWPASHLDQQHSRVREALKMPREFVLHSLRHTFGTRLGESGADAFTIMKLMGHSTVTVSQRYVHPSPEAIELAYARFTSMNTAASSPKKSPKSKS